MSIEEIINWLKYLEEDIFDENGKTAAVLDSAISLLRTHPEAQPKEPLTPEELREMDGRSAFLWKSFTMPGRLNKKGRIDMERLTKRRNGVCTYIGPRCMYPDTGETAAEMDFINARTVLERLAAYEDTGLEPEEITVQLEILRKYSEAADGIGLKRLRELAQAEKDWRLVVLPCKIGDTVWVLLEDGALCMARVQGISTSATCEDILLRFGGYPPVFVWGSDIGKTWFLTRQEAEEALKK